MEQDPDAIKNLDREFEETIARERAQAENELKEEIGKAHTNSTKALTTQNIKDIENNFWTKKQPELDNRNIEYEKRMFENFDGSREVALQRMEDAQDQIQKAKELQESQSLNMQSENQKSDERMQQQQREKDDKDKKEKKEQEITRDKEKQLNADQAKKQDIALQRDRLREQFNQQSRSHSLDQGKGQEL